ncbi:unnamed protein product [Sphagnum tenellum]
MIKQTPAEKLIEAIEFIQQGYDALDQAHSIMKDLGIHREHFGKYYGRNVTLYSLAYDLGDFLLAIQKEHFCTNLGCKMLAETGTPFCADCTPEINDANAVIGFDRMGAEEARDRAEESRG